MEQWALMGFRGAVEEFKRRLIETSLRLSDGNRTHAARRLGLQRTYLLRLMRDLGVSVPRSGSTPGAAIGRPLPVAQSGARAVEPGAPARLSSPVVSANGSRPSRPSEKR